MTSQQGPRIVDDIVATGKTCAFQKSQLLILGSKTVKICAMLHYSGGQKHDVVVDYFGFTVTHVCWVGYGLDFKGADRNLPSICQLQYPYHLLFRIRTT